MTSAILSSPFNPRLKTAVIYAIEQLFAYTIEIKEGNASYYISNKEGPVIFKNVEDARQAALKEGAKEAYLALSKTSQESDLSSFSSKKLEDRFDYSPIPLIQDK